MLLMRIIIGTQNEKKITVVQSVFADVLKLADIDVVSHNARSKVPEAPHDKETYQGAENRALECEKLGGADFYVGIESGLVERYGMYFEETWAVIIRINGAKQVGYSSGLMLPSVVVERMNNGEKHNDIMRSFDEEFQLPPDNRDTWSRYTGGAISRDLSLREALRNALIQTVESDQSLYAY